MGKYKLSASQSKSVGARGKPCVLNICFFALLLTPSCKHSEDRGGGGVVEYVVFFLGAWDKYLFQARGDYPLSFPCSLDWLGIFFYTVISVWNVVWKGVRLPANMSQGGSPRHVNRLFF